MFLGQFAYFLFLPVPPLTTLSISALRGSHHLSAKNPTEGATHIQPTSGTKIFQTHPPPSVSKKSLHKKDIYVGTLQNVMRPATKVKIPSETYSRTK